MQGSTGNTLPSGKRNWIPALVVVVILFVLPLFLARMGRTGEYWIWVTNRNDYHGLIRYEPQSHPGVWRHGEFRPRSLFRRRRLRRGIVDEEGRRFTFLALLTAPVAAAVAAAIIGWFCVRLIGLYFAILTLAFSQLLYMIAFQWYTFTGGDDEYTGFQDPNFSTGNYYLLCLALFLICFLLMRMNSEFLFRLTIRRLEKIWRGPNSLG